MSGTSSETIHALAKAFGRSELTPEIVAQLRQYLDQFVAKHQDREDNPSTRVQEELRRICNEVLGTDVSKLEGFVTTLTVLVPYLRRIGELESWFDLVITVIIDALESRKSSVQQLQDFVLASVTYDSEAADAQERAKACRSFMAKLLQENMKRATALTQGTVTTTLRNQNRVQLQLQELVALVGRDHPQNLFSSFQSPLENPDTRYHALHLMSAWLKHQQPHLDVIARTSVIDVLLKCLMNDRSTAMISGALQCLLMLLPHIPVTVSTQLPKLFLIYSRCLCWEKFVSSSSQAQKDLVTDDRVRNESDNEDDNLFSVDSGWRVVDCVPDTPDMPAPELLYYFTYLYGLYPLNFTSYIRRPRKYLRQIEFPGADDFDLDQAVIRSRTEQYQRVHLLHPNFFNMTAEEELADNRWLKAEPAEVNAECLGLYSGGHATADTSPTDTNRLSLEAVMAKGSIADEAEPMSASSLTPVDSTSSLRPSATANSDGVFLQRELMATRNELTFEKHLKQQHAQAIGQLKRERVKAVAVEAETATLINMNRSLTRKLNEANKFNENLQKETQSRKTHARQSEDQLNAKLRSLRATLGDQQAQEASLKQAHADIELLRELVVEGEARALRFAEEVEQLKARLEGGGLVQGPGAESSA